jgi:formylmethanofuran dehydrogenase subunit E
MSSPINPPHTRRGGICDICGEISYERFLLNDKLLCPGCLRIKSKSEPKDPCEDFADRK